MADKIQQGQRAEMLLKDPLIEGFFTAFDKEIFERWTITQDIESRESLFQLKLAGDAFKAHLTSYVITGELEKAKDE